MSISESVAAIAQSSAVSPYDLFYATSSDQSATATTAPLAAAAVVHSFTISSITEVSNRLVVTGDKESGADATIREFVDGKYLGVVEDRAPDGKFSFKLADVSAGSHTMQFTLDGSKLTAKMAFITGSSVPVVPPVVPPTTPPTGTSESTWLLTHNFFAASSPWNTPISTTATFSAVPNLASYATGLTSWLNGGGNVSIYYAQATDPLVGVLYNANTWYDVYTGAWARSGNSAAVEKQILASSSTINPIPGNPYSTQKAALYWNSKPVSGLPAVYNKWTQTSELYMHVPAGALPTSSSDGQTVIIQPDGTAVELYSPVELSTGQWVSEMFSTTNAVSGTGTGVDNGRTASMVENYAGVLRDTDVTSGVISHALALAVPPAMLKAAFTGPATAFDSGSSDYSGTVAMGSHLGLAPTVNIATLGLTTTLGMEIAKAAQTYGMYVVDRGGSGISLITQNAPTSGSLESYSNATAADVAIIVHHESLIG